MFAVAQNADKNVTKIRIASDDGGASSVLADYNRVANNKNVKMIERNRTKSIHETGIAEASNNHCVVIVRANYMKQKMTVTTR